MNVFNMPINPDRWPIFTKIKGIGHIEPFRATKDMKEGDLLVLNIVENKKENYHRGVYGFAIVVKEMYLLNDKNDTLNDENVVDGKITHFKFDAPIIKFMHYHKYVKNDKTPSMLEQEGKDYILNKLSKIDENGNIIPKEKDHTIDEEKNKEAEEEFEDYEFKDDEITKHLEGLKIEKKVNIYKRSKEIRQQVIKSHGTICEACGFDFYKTYGEIGIGFIEVHHIDPISTWGEEREPDIENDFLCLCSNCHRMVHRNRKNVLSLDNLKTILLMNKYKQ